MPTASQKRYVLLLFLIYVTSVSAQQDVTVVWKAALADLDRRISASVTDRESFSMECASRPEDVRFSLAAFASAHPERSKPQIPRALADHPSEPELKQQLDAFERGCGRGDQRKHPAQRSTSDVWKLLCRRR